MKAGAVLACLGKWLLIPAAMGAVGLYLVVPKNAYSTVDVPGGAVSEDGQRAYPAPKVAIKRREGKTVNANAAIAEPIRPRRRRKPKPTTPKPEDQGSVTQESAARPSTPRPSAPKPAAPSDGGGGAGGPETIPVNEDGSGG